MNGIGRRSLLPWLTTGAVATAWICGSLAFAMADFHLDRDEKIVAWAALAILAIFIMLLSWLGARHERAIDIAFGAVGILALSTFLIAAVYSAMAATYNVVTHSPTVLFVFRVGAISVLVTAVVLAIWRWVRRLPRFVWYAAATLGMLTSYGWVAGITTLGVLALFEVAYALHRLARVAEGRARSNGTNASATTGPPAKSA